MKHFFQHAFLLTIASISSFQTYTSSPFFIQLHTKSNWFDYAKWGNLEKIKEFSDKLDVNIQDSVQGKTALTWAAYYGNLDVIRFLLSVPGIDVNRQDTNGWTPLMTACFKNQTAVVELLLNVPEIDVNAQDIFGNTALSITAETGVQSIANLLLLMPGIQIHNGYDKSALSIAQKQNRESMAELIANKLNQLCHKACEAITHNDLETLKLVAPQIGTIPVDADGNTLIDKAFAADNLPIIFYLLQQAKDPRELLARFPFELVSPSSELFELFIDLAFLDADSAKSQAKRKSVYVDSDAEMEPKKSTCQICEQETSNCCSRCKKVYYCCAEHQKADWATHKKVCKN